MDLPIKYFDYDWRYRRDVREEYIRRQNNICEYCKEYLDDNPSSHILNYDISRYTIPDGFLDHPIHLMYNKITGYTIGAVHSRCNAVHNVKYYEWLKDVNNDLLGSAVDII